MVGSVVPTPCGLRVVGLFEGLLAAFFSSAFSGFFGGKNANVKGKQFRERLAEMEEFAGLYNQGESSTMWKKGNLVRIVN